MLSTQLVYRSFMASRTPYELHLSQVLAQLERCRAYPDFNNYLALILAQGSNLQLEVGPASL